VKSSKANCSVAPEQQTARPQGTHAHMHMQQALECLPVLPVCSETLSKLKTHEKAFPTIDPPPIGRRSNPGPVPAQPGTSRKTSSPTSTHAADNSIASQHRHHAAHTPPASTRPPSLTKIAHRTSRADTIEQDLYGLKSSGHHGVQQWRARQPYKSFKSQYGPRYALRKNPSIGGHIESRRER